jgi:hypothetical protein
MKNMLFGFMLGVLVAGIGFGALYAEEINTLTPAQKTTIFQQEQQQMMQQFQPWGQYGGFKSSSSSASGKPC